MRHTDRKRFATFPGVLVAAAMFLVPAIAFAAGEGETGSSKLRLSMGGSTTVEPIITSAMEVFRAEVDGSAELSYDAPGSTAGIQGVLNGIYDIGATSRALFISEKQQGLEAIPIAIDGLAIIVHKSVSIDNISIKNLAAIYTGEIRNWNKLGGPNLPIVVVNRDEASGTLGAFRELVLERVYGDDTKFIKKALVTESNGNMATMVAQTPGAIGYASLATLARLRQEGGKTLTVDKIVINAENIYSGTYPIVRRLSMVTLGKPGTQQKVILDFLLGPRGQEIVNEVGYLPLR